MQEGVLPPPKYVDQGVFFVGAPGAETAIVVGSPAWFRWVETATAFTFTSPHGAFTARRERASSGRGGWYWRAEQRRAGVRRRAYLGKAEELTLEQLHTVAASLASATSQRYVPAHRVTEAAALDDDPREQPAPPPGKRTNNPHSSNVPLPDLLTTKLYIPPARPALVVRPRLLDQLSRGLAGKLTVIAAPAGFGKTSLLANWLGWNDERGTINDEASEAPIHRSSLIAQRFNVAWLSLDPADNDSTTFLR
jgi:hypothetical protein